MSDDKAHHQPGRATKEAPASQLAAIGALLRDSLTRLTRPPRLGRRGWWLLAGLALIGWASTSYYEVTPDEQGVVWRFGREIGAAGPGRHFHLPFPIDIVAFHKTTPRDRAAPAHPSAQTGGSRS